MQVPLAAYCVQSREPSADAWPVSLPAAFPESPWPLVSSHRFFVSQLQSECLPPIRPRHLYYRTNRDKVSVWNYGISDISWRSARSSTTDEPHKGYGWRNLHSRVRFRIWKMKLASNYSSVCRAA